MRRLVTLFLSACILTLVTFTISCQAPAEVPAPPTAPAPQTSGASLALVPNTVAAGSSVTAYCAGFPPERLVQVGILAPEIKWMQSVECNKAGAVKIPLVAADFASFKIEPGLYTIVAQAANGQAVATAALEITPKK